MLPTALSAHIYSRKLFLSLNTIHVSFYYAVAFNPFSFGFLVTLAGKTHLKGDVSSVSVDLNTFRSDSREFSIRLLFSPGIETLIHSFLVHDLSLG